MLKLKIFNLCCAVILISGCSGSSNWIDIGTISANLNSEKALEIPYRLYKYNKVEKNIDFLDLTLQAQSGKAVGKLALLKVYKCYAPKVREGLPSVQCEDSNGTDFILAGNEQVRSQLLHIQGGQQASVVGKILGIYGTSGLIIHVP